MIELRLAKTEEIDQGYACIDSGRKFQQEQGFLQWTDGYPNREIVADDIANGRGFVVTVDGKIACYMCLTFDGDESYKDIDGAWETGEPYVVIHRMSILKEYRNIGLSKDIFDLVEKYALEKGVENFRIDTDRHNKRMQHCLEKQGMTYRGTILFEGDKKLAYDKKLK